MAHYLLFGFYYLLYISLYVNLITEHLKLFMALNERYVNNIVTVWNRVAARLPND